MPTYEYQCLDCKEVFTRVESIRAPRKALPTCPECKSRRVERILSPVFAKTSKKS